MEALRARGECTGLEASFRTRDGGLIRGLMSARVLELNGEACILSISRDLTERLKAEETRLHMEAQLAHAQKMESLGTLASGVAHDMNNVLMAIMGIAEAMRVTHPQDGAITEGVEVIQRAGERGRVLVQGLTHFARKGVREALPLDLNGLVREEMTLLRRTLLQKVDLEEDLETPLPRVMGEAGALGAVLMNLAVNAVDAMPGGGRITFRTRSLPGEVVELSVTDTGEGMPQEVLAKAVEPFYTTKPPGKGTGLGLSMAYSTARAHGGSLRLQSEPGRGTTVTLLLPGLAGGLEASAAPASIEATRPLRILLVDDEELIRVAVPPMLNILGHDVQTAGGGQRALDLLVRGPAPDLVILDLNRPGMGGAETLKRVRSGWPALPVLVATGYLDEATEGDLGLDPHAGFIRKPFALDEIRMALHRLPL